MKSKTETNWETNLWILLRGKKPLTSQSSGKGEAVNLNHDDHVNKKLNAWIFIEERAIKID